MTEQQTAEERATTVLREMLVGFQETGMTIIDTAELDQLRADVEALIEAIDEVYDCCADRVRTPVETIIARYREDGD